jgi:hypothetical protein
VLHFGSHVSGASPGAKSAYDLLAVVGSYRRFYRSLRAARPGSPPAAVLSVLNRFLPPNILFFAPRGGSGPGAKLFVVSEAHLERDLSPRGRDHFCCGRLMQRVELVFARDEAAAERARGLLEANRRATLEWMRPFLPGDFDARGFASRALEISYAQEIRPESPARRLEVFRAQEEFFLETYGAILEEAERAGLLVRTAGGYRYARPASAAERRRVRRYFAISKLRATSRWLKYTVTFENWSEYLAAKVERRTGVRVELSPRERRLPLLFLWPKLVRFLRASGPRDSDDRSGGRGSP